jgi:hypothetical protein
MISKGNEIKQEISRECYTKARWIESQLKEKA